MTIGTGFAILRQHRCAHRIGILRAEFEDVTNLHRLENFERAGIAARTGFAGIDRAQVGPLIDLNVALDIDAAKVMVVFVGAGRHVAAALKREVGDDQQILAFASARLCLCAHPAQTAGARAEQIANLLRRARVALRSRQRVGKFRFVQLMIAAQQTASTGLARSPSMRRDNKRAT